MKLLKSVTFVLASSAAPTVLTAQVVELRSSDNFISVEGEITGFNGTMVTIQSTVGPVSVPASGVICFGAGCSEVLASNPFGLTAESFAGVVDGTEAESAPLADALTVSFALPSYEVIYRNLVTAFAQAGQAEGVTIDDAASLSVDASASDGSATIAIAAEGAAGDIVLTATGLSGSAAQDYVGPSGWATATTPGQQMVALRAFAVVTANDVGVDSITMTDLAGIYAGEITNWSQIGGADLTVLPLQLPVTSEVREEFIAVVMDPAGKTIADNVLTMADESSIAAAISGFAGSISVVNVGNTGAAPVLPVAGACGVAVAPTDFNIASGDYPLVGPVVARFDTTPVTPLPAQLFDFAVTDTVQDGLRDAGFIRLGALVQNPVERNIRLTALLTANPAPEERPVAAQMFQTLFEAERLTPTMSGGPASGAEGAWNRAMMLSLADILAQPDYAGRQVIFAGFGDSANGVLDAVDRSAGAAAAMAAAFSAFAPSVVADNDLTVTSAGFGGVSRTTCYQGQVAGPAHSRIEVWVK